MINPQLWVVEVPCMSRRKWGEEAVVTLQLHLFHFCLSLWVFITSWYFLGNKANCQQGHQRATVCLIDLIIFDFFLPWILLHIQCVHCQSDHLIVQILGEKKKCMLYWHTWDLTRIQVCVGLKMCCCVFRNITKPFLSKLYFSGKQFSGYLLFISIMLGLFCWNNRKFFSLAFWQ